MRGGTAGRQGAAVVELAFLLPLFVVSMLGIAEMSRGTNATALLISAVRESGRLGSMEIRDFLPEGMTANQKIESDIRTFLNLSGFPGDEVEISITHAEGEDAGEVFDLQDPDNYLELFTINARIPYSQVSSFPLVIMEGRDLSASITFRRGRVNMNQ